MERYRVAQVGCGVRGDIHLHGFTNNPDRFEMVGLCDMNTERLDAIAGKYGITAKYSDAETMLRETKPDIFCFITLPHGRQSFVELGISHGVKGIAFEKPMATALTEARSILKLCETNGIKAVVSHQQKYLPAMQKMKSIMDAGDIGEIETIHVKAVSWYSQLGTHLVDYALWMGGAHALWAVGHTHGRTKLTDSHPSTDYLMGQIALENGIRVIFESGYCAPRRMMPENVFWTNNRLTAYGTHGYAWAETDGRWGAFTRNSGGRIGGVFKPWVDSHYEIQTPYLKEFADWMDDDAKVHSCTVATAYHGYEIVEGMCFSALDNTRVDFPMKDIDRTDVLTRAAAEVPETPMSSGFDTNTKTWSIPR